MEVVLILLTSIVISVAYLKHAPMSEIEYILYQQNSSNAKHKDEISATVTTTTK